MVSTFKIKSLVTTMSSEDTKDAGFRKDRKKVPFSFNKTNNEKKFEGRCEELKGYI